MLLIIRKYVWIFVALCVLASCKREEEQQAPEPVVLNPGDTTGTFKPTPYVLKIPAGFPTLVIPANNPLTVEGVALGKKLFNDKMLSADNSISCASCHKQQFSFVDEAKFSTGVGGKTGVRNSMPLFNLGWAEMFNPTAHRFMWDGGNPDLENQVIAPIQNPVEMNQSLSVLEHKLKTHPEYPALFKKAFGTDSVTIKYVMFAIAQFERTLISGSSKYDKSKQGLASLTEQEQRGLSVFIREEKGGCFHCHGNDRSPFFTNYRFHNNGLDSIPVDKGLGAITGIAEDNGKFKVPSLRNLAFTAPYMHDGRFNTLEEVVEFYNSGVKSGPTTDQNLKDHVTRGGLNLTEQDKKDLVAFLNTLNDYEFLVDEKFK